MSFKVRMTLQIRYNETKNDKQTGDKFEIVACQSYSVPVAAADKHQGAVNNRTYKNPECLQSDFIRAQNKLAEHKRSKPAHNEAWPNERRKPELRKRPSKRRREGRVRRRSRVFRHIRDDEEAPP